MSADQNPIIEAASPAPPRYRVIKRDTDGAFVFAIRLLTIHSLLTDSERSKVIKRLNRWRARGDANA
jgi:hypothetical protein